MLVGKLIKRKTIKKKYWLTKEQKENKNYNEKNEKKNWINKRKEKKIMLKGQVLTTERKRNYVKRKRMQTKKK